MTILFAAYTSKWLKIHINQADKQYKGKIIGTYDHSLIIDFDSLGLIHITNENKNLSPFSILVDGFFVDKLVLDQTVTFENNSFDFGTFTVCVPEDVNVYNESAVIFVKSCDYCLPEDLNVSPLFVERFLSVREILLETYVTNNKLQVAFNFIKLLGLGEGLTPSGDDYIVGFLYGLYNLDRKDIIEILNEIIQKDLDKLTNKISKEFINHALNGRFSMNIINHNWYDLLTFGHTSGYFTYLGIADSINDHELVLVLR